MPTCIQNLMNKLKHVPPLRPQNSPYPTPCIECGKKIQKLLPEDESPLIPEQGVKFTQSTIGAALCLARIIDSTLLFACNVIATQQTKATTKTLSSCEFVLDHTSSNPDSSMAHCESDMQLWVVSDASHLSVSKSRSKAGGFNYLRNAPDHAKTLPQQQKFLNAPIHVEASILKPVAGAASEAEIEASCANSRKPIPFRISLLEMAHQQNFTPL